MDNHISRQAAIGTVKKHYRVDNDLLEVIVYELENLPSAQPEQKWIPCTPKTMPPYWVLVWVTDNHGHVAVCQLSHKENHYWYDGDERWMYEHDSIIAWMPYNVPEPYQAERREE